MNLIETIERKRKEYRDRQEQSGVGTLVGLREMLKKRKMAALEQPKPKQEELPHAN